MRRKSTPKSRGASGIADLKETALPAHSDITSVVYWPGEGYGGADMCRSMEEARARVDDLAKLGYGDGKRHTIRIVRTTREIIEFALPVTE